MSAAAQAVAIPGMTREALFAEVKALEEKTFDLINDDSRQDEFDAVMDRTAELMGMARARGWIA